MIIQPVGERGAIFTFDDHISVYAIGTERRVFLCDTHLGPYSMEGVKQYILRRWPAKELILFNSHADWDHIWGNCAFPGALIVGHELCRARVRETGEYDRIRLADQQRGAVELMPPNLTFTTDLHFVEDEVYFRHAPGHTADSAICFDRHDAVLFVGDLVEEPIPYVDYPNLKTYIQTLEDIREMPARVRISAHSGPVDTGLIDRNITYLDALLCGNPLDPGGDKAYQSVHHINKNNLILLRWERVIRDKLGAGFDYQGMRAAFARWEQMRPEELDRGLAEYAAGIERLKPQR